VCPRWTPSDLEAEAQSCRQERDVRRSVIGRCFLCRQIGCAGSLLRRTQSALPVSGAFSKTLCYCPYRPYLCAIWDIGHVDATGSNKSSYAGAPTDQFDAICRTACPAQPFAGGDGVWVPLTTLLNGAGAVGARPPMPAVPSGPQSADPRPLGISQASLTTVGVHIGVLLLGIETRGRMRVSR
jgi:hypothetical protein